MTAAAVFGKSARKEIAGGNHGFGVGGSHGFGASSFWTRWVRSWLVNDGVRPLGRLGSALEEAAGVLGRGGVGASALLPPTSTNARHLLRAYIVISVSQRRREGR